MTGPCLPAAASLDPLASEVLGRLPSGVSIVYVSLGTVFNDKPALFRALIEGAAATGAHVVVSAGASFEALAKLQFRTFTSSDACRRWRCCKRVNTVITHGGKQHGAGMSGGRTSNGGRSFRRRSGSERATRRAAGSRRALPVKQLTPQAVQQALSSVSASTVLERAAALSKALKAYGGASAAAESIVDLVARGTL
jgi:UDP:flavonoid glycosyltransferase YjiC (YdhE family)